MIQRKIDNWSLVDFDGENNMCKNGMMKIFLCAIFFLLVSCSTEKDEQELNSIEKEYLEKRETFSAAYCVVYGFPVKPLGKIWNREFGTSKIMLRNDKSAKKGIFEVADSSVYKHAFSLSFPLEEDSSAIKNFYATYNLLVDCFNRDSLYLGSITVNDRCQTSNSNGRMDKRMLVELKSVFPEWYDSYEKACK